MKLKEQLLHTLRTEDGWVHSGHLETMEFNSPKGTRYKPSTVGRTLRLLSEEDERVTQRIEGKSVSYKYEMNEFELYHKQNQIMKNINVDEKARELFDKEQR